MRAVVAYRNGWMTQRITGLLTDRAVHVVGAYVDGADAVGTVVAEQSAPSRNQWPQRGGEVPVRGRRSAASDAQRIASGRRCLDAAQTLLVRGGVTTRVEE